MKGKILKLPHVTVAPYEQATRGWFCVVIASSHPSYPIGGYNIVVPDDELALGVEMTVVRKDVAQQVARRGGK